MPILTAKVCRSNAEQFPEILELYVPPPAKVLDMTWGNGVFWQQVDGDYDVWRNDISGERGDHHYDAGSLPQDWAGTFNAVIFDPPYLGVGGLETLKDSIDRGYQNRERGRRGLGGISGVRRLYARGIASAWEVLSRSGILIIKTMDQVESGQQNFLSHDVMELCRILGFKVEDEFIYVSATQPTMRHERQIHARRNHSSWIVAKRRP